MEQIGMLIAPVLVWIITGGVKKLTSMNLSKNGTFYVRMLVIVFSFAATMGNTWVNGQAVDPTSVKTLADALVVFLGSQGTFFLTKRK